MSLDIYLTAVRPTTVYSGNITHNLTEMANAAGIYKHLWRPEEIGITHAHQLVQPLTAALVELRANPERFKKYDAPNGWGRYEHFVEFVKEVRDACEANPDAAIEASR